MKRRTSRTGQLLAMSDSAGSSFSMRSAETSSTPPNT